MTDGTAGDGKRERLDSSLESKGAAFLVPAGLMIEAVRSYVADDRNAGIKSHLREDRVGEPAANIGGVPA